MYDAQEIETEVPNAIFLVPKLFSTLLFVAVHTITAPDDDVYSTRTLPLGDAFGWRAAEEQRERAERAHRKTASAAETHAQAEHI